MSSKIVQLGNGRWSIENESGELSGMYSSALAASQVRPMRDEHTPKQVRDYCQLSALTRDELGRERATLSAELKNAQTIFDNHEAEGWADYPEADYDTVFPELRNYIETLHNLPGLND